MIMLCQWVFNSDHSFQRCLKFRYTVLDGSIRFSFFGRWSSSEKFLPNYFHLKICVKFLKRTYKRKQPRNHISIDQIRFSIF